MPAGLTSGASAAFAFVRSFKPYPGPFGFIPRDELDAGLFQGCLDFPERFCRPLISAVASIRLIVAT